VDSVERVVCFVLWVSAFSQQGSVRFKDPFHGQAAQSRRRGQGCTPNRFRNRVLYAGSAAGTRHTVYAKQRFSPCLQVGISDDQRGNCAQRDSNSGLVYYNQLNAPYEHYTPYVVEIARDTCSEDVVSCNFIAQCKILENISRIKTS